MKKLIGVLFLVTLFIFQVSCAPVPPTLSATAQATDETLQKTKTCKPTLNDGVSPSYNASTPERNIVGSGHILTGRVLSSADCEPIANAKLEFWTEEAGLGHPDTGRATFYTDENGNYRFECNQPEHIHMRISAEGFKTIGVNSYHPEGAVEGIFDFVLVVEP